MLDGRGQGVIEDDDVGRGQDVTGCWDGRYRLLGSIPSVQLSKYFTFVFSHPPSQNSEVSKFENILGLIPIDIVQLLKDFYPDDQDVRKILILLSGPIPNVQLIFSECSEIIRM